eukprot:scaffold2499_cov125-Cylindrotheca_fusiformis.AAC.8
MYSTQTPSRPSVRFNDVVYFDDNCTGKLHYRPRNNVSWQETYGWRSWMSQERKRRGTVSHRASRCTASHRVARGTAGHRVDFADSDHLHSQLGELSQRFQKKDMFECPPMPLRLPIRKMSPCPAA